MADLKLGFFEKIRKGRAEKELGIVEASSSYVQKKYNESRLKAAGYRRKADSQAAEVIKLYDSKSAPLEDIEDLKALVELTEAQYSTEQDNKRLFMNIHIMLEQLSIYVKTLIDLGDYKYVTKIIPEKDIPKYVKKSQIDELSAVAGIVADIVDSVQTRLTKSFYGRTEVAEAIKKARAIGESMRKDFLATPSEQKDSMADFKAKYAGAAATATSYAVPDFSAATATAEQQKPTNKV